MRACHLSSGVPDARPEREYSVHLWGGEALRLRLAARNLSAIGEGLRQERALLGRMLVEEDGCSTLVGVLVPSGRIQLVVDHDG